MTIQSRNNIQKTIAIPNKYDGAARDRIGQMMVQKIKDRTASGISANGTAFKYAKKSPHRGNNLSDSGDMLAMLEVVSHTQGAITVGYKDITSIEANQAEGISIGTYGNDDPNPALAKPFIGISSEELDLILNRVDQELPKPSLSQQEQALIDNILRNL